MKPHAAVYALLGAALLWIGLRRFERMMVFVPSRTMLAQPGVAGLTWEPHAITASDGVTIKAWWIPGAKADAPVMLCLHGNGGNLSYRVDKMKLFHDAGAAQLWIDWRGYGESGGTPDENGLYRDALAAWAWLGARGVPAERLVLYGESLGCAAAVELAGRVPAAGLIVDSGFTSIPDMAKVVLPWFPARLVKLKFDTVSKLPRVTIPTLFLHSPDDDVIPFEMARRNLAASGAARKSLVELTGSHNEGFLEAGPAYPRAVRDFVAGLSSAPPKQP